MQKLATQVRLAAETDASVFIVGESGAGKEVVARAIHEASERRDHPFIAVNCGAISGSLAHAELFGHERQFHRRRGAERRLLRIGQWRHPVPG